MTIEEFKQTQDYKDIMYMIKHVPYHDARVSVLKELGYKISIIILKNNVLQTLGHISLNKKGQILIQITKKIKQANYAFCVII